MQAARTPESEAYRIARMAEARTPESEARRISKVLAAKTPESESKRIANILAARTPENEAKRLARLAEVRTPEFEARRIASVLAGNTPEVVARRLAQLAKVRTPEFEAKRIASLKRGADHPGWVGGPSVTGQRPKELVHVWRTAVFQRDDYTCQMCGQRGGRLQADHIKPYATYPDLRWDVSNGRTLCVPCHKKTPTYGGNVSTKPRRVMNKAKTSKV
jgi:hypothetical protein